MSYRYGPSPFAMNTGSPPTPPNARAGLFTPPGIRRRACSNARRLFSRLRAIVPSSGPAGSHPLGAAVVDLLDPVPLQAGDTELPLRGLATPRRALHG